MMTRLAAGSDDSGDDWLLRELEASVREGLLVMSPPPLNDLTLNDLKAPAVGGKTRKRYRRRTRTAAEERAKKAGQRSRWSPGTTRRKREEDVQRHRRLRERRLAEAAAVASGAAAARPRSEQAHGAGGGLGEL